MVKKLSGEFCGCPVEAFATRPEPEDLAGIVSQMDSEEQAQFFITLGEQLKRRCSYEEYGVQMAYIRDAIAAMEVRDCHGYGSQLIADLQPLQEVS